MPPLLGKLLLLTIAVFSGPLVAEGLLLLPKTSLGAHELGLVINERDPLSREIGRYYQLRRGIPDRNIAYVQLPPGQAITDLHSFRQAFARVDKVMPKQVQALVLAWTFPYRVGCMSMTTAFATGYREHYCQQSRGEGRCRQSGRSPYFSSDSKQPYRDFGIRPTMMLAARSTGDARRLIDRGVSSDASFPAGTAYLLSTSDKARSVRDRTFSLIEKALSARVDVQVLNQDVLRDKDDVLFYFTGKARVSGLDTLRFRPGAVADHLTSFGGQMTEPGEGKQMSSLRWLEAGASGSYGTVTEPCNFPAKFPEPGLLIAAYTGGSSLIEAYWKSVASPGQGLFIGEPLAAPFHRSHIAFEGQTAVVPIEQIGAGQYHLQVAEFPVGPYRDTGPVIRPTGTAGGSLRLTGLDKPYYRLRRLRDPAPAR